MITKSCKRSSSTSTSVSVIRSMFEAFTKKDLSILAVIDVYNYYMNEVDIANQL